MSEINLPEGTKPYSGNIFINLENSSLWTGKRGNYLQIATKEDIDNFKVNPLTLGVTPPTQPIPGLLKLPLTNNGADWIAGGIYASANEIGFGSNALAIRVAGRLKISDAIEDNEAVSKKQLDDLGIGIHVDNIDSEITNASRSLILKSETSTIDNPNALSKQNVIINSSNVEIVGNVANKGFISASENVLMRSPLRNAVIASEECELLSGRMQSAIIASTQSVIETYSNLGMAKWNSAIIAGKVCVIRSNASYALATGKGTISNSSGQFVCGQNNIDEPGVSVDSVNKKAFIVGNGTGSDDTQPTVRSNAFHVTQGGKVWVQNELEVDNVNGIILKAPNGNRYRISVSNTGVLTTNQL